MNNIRPQEDGRGIIVTINGSDILRIRGKVGRRIHQILRKDSLCNIITNYRRRKNGNCFTTAQYIGQGETKGVGKLNAFFKGKYKFPDYSSRDTISSIGDAIERYGFPFYGEIINPKDKPIHAFVVLGKAENDYICFHQRGDRGVYEVITLAQIIQDLRKTHWHEGYGSIDYYNGCRFMKVI